jgi:hypothetical protein
MDTSKVKDAQRFAEIEFCVQRYFDGNIAKVMEATRKELSNKQVKELADYQKSARGMVSQAAASMAHDLFYSPMDTLKMTGEWNSKTAEDYVKMCKEQMLKNQNLQSDLVKLSDEWRRAVIGEIGRERYDNLSKQMGCDLAFAYMDYRVDQMMVDYMVKKEMPKSSIQYVMRKGAEGSLLGLSTVLSKSPLQQEIDKRGEAAYKPSSVEKGAGRAVSFGADAITTGGISSWGSLAKLVGVEVVFAGVENWMEKKVSKEQPMTVEQCISRGVFGSNANVFDGFRKQGKGIVSYENAYVLSVNNQLKNKMSIATTKPVYADWMETTAPKFPLQTQFLKTEEVKPHNPDVPFVIDPAQEEAYLASQKESKKQTMNTVESTTSEETFTPTESPAMNEENKIQQTNENGWSSLLQSVGLDGLSDVGRNLPYVIAMLPDMLAGLFTGKTKSLGLKDNMIPIASILVGMFVKNPLLKMVLIGMGGANLFNKVGHEAIGRMEGNTARPVQYREYPDEELNPRITHPVLQGNTLVATIDKVPCSILLPENAAQAYAAGALPLNTLANAVLAKHDQLRATTQENIRNIDIDTTVTRDRGITFR